MNTKPKTTRRRNISITDADYAALAMLGNGNASQGIREALKRSDRIENMLPPAGVAIW
jgi:hypothetical protein